VTPTLQKKLPQEWIQPRPEKGWHTQAALAGDWQACRELTRAHATSFFFASFPLPDAKKRAAYAVYALCRWFDDIIDEAEDDLPDETRLRDELDAIESGHSTLPFARAVAEVNHQYAIPRCFWEDLITGVCMDRQPVIIQTRDELELYCYHVASVVGLIMGKIFGLAELAGVPRAVELGLAMQMTNILRDIQEDFLRGRIYLPTEVMRAFDTGPEAIAAQRHHDPDWQSFVRGEIALARQYYQLGEAGLPFLANDGSRFTTKLMSRVYGGILDEIERRHYDVFTARCYVPTWRKVSIALRAVLS